MNPRAMATVLGACALWLTGCPCGPPAQLLGPHWNFEGSDCAGRGPLCGYVVTAGAAREVQAFTPGEHALQLDFDSRVVTGTNATLMGTQSFVPDAHLVFLARCDVGTTLEVTSTMRLEYVPLRADAGSTTGSTVQTATSSATTAPGRDWGRAQIALMPAPDPGGGALSTATLDDLAFVTHGPGSCTVDEIQLTTQQFLCE